MPLNFDKIILFFCTVCALAEVSAQTPVTPAKSIEERLQELEVQQKIMDAWLEKYSQQKRDSLVPTISENINLGGFLETAIAHIYGPDTPSQTAPYSNVLGLNLTAQLTERTRVVTQAGPFFSFLPANPYNNPALTPKQRTFLTAEASFLLFQGYFEYSQNRMFNVQFGLGPIPFGYAFPQREPFLFYTRGGPQMMNINEPDTISVFQWHGVHLHGSIPADNFTWGYNLYTFTPYLLPKVLNLGGRMWVSPSENLTLGFSVQTGRRRPDRVSFVTHGFDFKTKYNRYLLTAEYAISKNSGEQHNIESYYIEPAIEFLNAEWLLYLRADYLSHPGRVSSGVPDPTKHLQKSIGVNWLPYQNVRYRLGFVKHDFIEETDTIQGQRRDYDRIEFSVVTAF